MHRHPMILLVITALLAVAAAATPRAAAAAAKEPLRTAQTLPATPPPPPPSRSARTTPLSVVSIIPAQGEPGVTVTLNGAGFTGATSVLLGNRELQPTVISGRVLTFELPDLPPGVYALYLRREDGATSRAYNFVLQPQKPVISALSPDTVSSCASGRQREVVLSGANFQEGSRVLLDGAAVGTRFISPAALSFQAPDIRSGLHQVQVRNPSDAVSGSAALIIESKPQIRSVAIGSEYVSYYELIITGENFQQSSVLVADGNRIGTGEPVAGERDQIVFLGCNQLVYQRHPYDPSPKEIRLQVVNQNGEESGVITISAP